MIENVENMTFNDYYNQLKDEFPTFRRRVCQELEISYKTFYNKMNGESSWTRPEQEMIAKILNRPVDELFPEKQTA